MSAVFLPYHGIHKPIRLSKEVGVVGMVMPLLEPPSGVWNDISVSLITQAHECQCCDVVFALSGVSHMSCGILEEAMQRFFLSLRVLLCLSAVLLAPAGVSFAKHWFGVGLREGPKPARRCGRTLETAKFVQGNKSRGLEQASAVTGVCE